MFNYQVGAGRMAGMQKARSEETQRRVLAAATALMEEGGLRALQIRAVAERAGCSVGSVYKHYADVDALIIAVNGITLTRIRAAMTAATKGLSGPVVRLKALAAAYLGFARDNANLWRGLFDHDLPDDKPIPEEHRQENVMLLSFIGSEIHALDPSLNEAALAARARTCFAAVHGLVAISLEKRFIGLPGASLSSEMDFLVERLAGR